MTVKWYNLQRCLLIHSCIRLQRGIKKITRLSIIGKVAQIIGTRNQLIDTLVSNGTLNQYGINDKLIHFRWSNWDIVCWKSCLMDPNLFVTLCHLGDKRRDMKPYVTGPNGLWISYWRYWLCIYMINVPLWRYWFLYIHNNWLLLCPLE